MVENLWPTDFGQILEKTPVAILREEGFALGERTSNIVVGRVGSESAPAGHFRHGMSLFCAPLGYQAPFLYVDHDINLYPAKLFIEGEEGAPIQANNPAELAAHLKEVFAREKTKKMIASLIAQSKQ